MSQKWCPTFVDRNHRPYRYTVIVLKYRVEVKRLELNFNPCLRSYR